MPKWLFFLLMLGGLMLAVLVESVRTAHKREQRIRRQFGVKPDPCFRRTHIVDYWQQLCKHQPPEGAVDDTTWNDLNMTEVYDRINVCQSAIGEDYLYAVLHSPLQKTVLLQARERLLATLDEDTFRVKVQVLLAKLGRRVGADLPALLFEAEAFSLPAPWQVVAGALALPLCLCASGFFGAIGLWAMALVALHNIWLFYKMQKQLGNKIETMGYLQAALGCARKLQALTVQRCPQYAALLAKQLSPLQKTKVSPAALTPSMGSDSDAVLRVFFMVTLLPLVQYSRTVKLLTQHKQALQSLYCLLGEMEVAACVCSYRASLEGAFVVPVFGQALEIRATGLVHPLVRGAVANNAHISGSWLLTGSNASGKSTFLRAVAINNILAQTIHTCTAQQYALALAPVITSMAVEDDVLDGESYFVAEVRSMRRIVAAVDTGKAQYCFIDEILKGTNTAERVAASGAILHYLHRPNCLCVAATHDIELTQQLAPAYQNYHFSEQITLEGVQFDYTLKQGACTTRNAIRLLGVYNFPAGIVAQARAQAGEAIEAEVPYPSDFSGTCAETGAKT